MVFASVAHAGFLQYESSAGWNFGYPDDTGILHQGATPSMAFTGDFTRHGALCPAAGTDDYLCANAFGAAEIHGRLLALRASARIARHKATDQPGHEDLAYGGGRITMCGLTGAVASPVGYAVFNLALAGTATKSQSDASLVVHATGFASLNGTAVQCVGDGTPCDPVKIAHFDPAGCTLLDLRADANVTNPLGVSNYDAEADAAFADTLTLLAIEARDENDQPMPGVQFSLVDGQGATLVTFPNVVETTTTTVPGGGTTTTTTLPGGCADDASYASVECRLDALGAAVSATGAGAVGTRLGAKLSAARAAVARAEQTVGQHHGKPTRTSLKKALKGLKSYATLLGSKKARHAIDDATRVNLGAPADALRTDLGVLLASVAR